MSERPRMLPSWMAKKEKEKQPMKSGKQQKHVRAAFYCMNEKELVEAAVSYLTSEDAVLLAGQQAADSNAKMEENPSSTANPVTEEEEEEEEEEAAACTGAEETTYVSESDLDIAELGTVPYTKSLQHQRPEPGLDHDGDVGVGLKAEDRDEPSQRAAESDDALQLVREIFFTR